MSLVESVESTLARRSNVQGRKNAPQKIRSISERISFRDLARLAFPRKTAATLADLTSSDLSTCKRWLANRQRRPQVALVVVLGEIMRRLD
jgi:uracil-DNA glycosylase